MEFKVKRDFLLVFLINIALAFLLCVAVFYFCYNTVVLIVSIVITGGLLALFNTSVIFACCKLDEEKLVFRTGLFKYEIKHSEILKVTKETNYYTSLALSSDRVRILTKTANSKQKVYYVSVVDNDKLLSVLKDKSSIKKEKEVKKPATKTTKKVATSTKTKKTTKK